MTINETPGFIQISRMFPLWSFFGPRFQSKKMSLHFRRRVSVFLCFSWLWHFWGVLIRHFVDSPSGWVWCFSHDETGVKGLGKEYRRGDVPVPSHLLRMDLTSVHFITGDGNSDHFFKKNVFIFLRERRSREKWDKQTPHWEQSLIWGLISGPWGDRSQNRESNS